MAPNNRSSGRNVHIYQIEDPDVELGGLRLVSGITNSNFFFMLEILFRFGSDYHLRDKSGSTMKEMTTHFSLELIILTVYSYSSCLVSSRPVQP